LKLRVAGAVGEAVWVKDGEKYRQIMEALMDHVGQHFKQKLRWLESNSERLTLSPMWKTVFSIFLYCLQVST
jgi:hypothetical protein